MIGSLSALTPSRKTYVGSTDGGICCTTQAAHDIQASCSLAQRPLSCAPNGVKGLQELTRLSGEKLERYRGIRRVAGTLSRLRRSPAGGAQCFADSNHPSPQNLEPVFSGLPLLQCCY